MTSGNFRNGAVAMLLDIVTASHWIEKYEEDDLSEIQLTDSEKKELKKAAEKEFKNNLKKDDFDSNSKISINSSFNASKTPSPKKETVKAPKNIPNISTTQEIKRYFEPLIWSKYLLDLINVALTCILSLQILYSNNMRQA